MHIDIQTIDGAPVPVYAHDGDAACDLRAACGCRTGSSWNVDKLKAAWNRRAERTCRVEEDAESVAKLFDNFDADASDDIRAIVRRCKSLAERG